jgi:ubiquinone/menaquinone biosynthesis C-methylase UbiE
MGDSAQINYWLDERHLAYHRRQFSEPYRSTVFLGELLRNEIGGNEFDGSVLDVACGAGAGMAHLSRLFPRASITGVDIADDIFPVGLQLMREQGIQNLPRFVRGDIYKLGEQLTPASYDVVLSIQTLSWLPEYEPALAPLLSMAKPNGVIVISSLFTDALVDARIELKQFNDATFKEAREQIHYNVYCFERFVNECRKLGARSVQGVDFVVDCDLPKPSHRHMGTYTEKLSDGRRIQLSGPLLMPWKFVIVRMGEAVGLDENRKDRKSPV